MLIREKDGTKEVLLALRKNTGYRDGEYELPGGHVEEGEDLMQAMVREAKEELLINIKEEDFPNSTCFTSLHRESCELYTND